MNQEAKRQDKEPFQVKYTHHFFDKMGVDEERPLEKLNCEHSTYVAGLGYLLSHLDKAEGIYRESGSHRAVQKILDRISLYHPDIEGAMPRHESGIKLSTKNGDEDISTLAKIAMNDVHNRMYNLEKILANGGNINKKGSDMYLIRAGAQGTIYG